MEVNRRVLTKSIVLWGFLFLLSACNKTSHLLPAEYNISIEEKFDTALNHGRILKVKPRIEEKDLKGYPKNYKKNWLRKEENTLQGWTKLDELPNKKAIISNIGQILDFGDYEQIDNLLREIHSENHEIYFSGLGQVTKGIDNKEHNFYQFMYFLDLSKNEIYEFDDIH